MGAKIRRPVRSAFFLVPGISQGMKWAQETGYSYCNSHANKDAISNHPISPRTKRIPYLYEYM
jgi:hypothetical protein